MADIKITPIDAEGGRKVLVDGIPIPDVTDVSLLFSGGSVDEVTITIHANSFSSMERQK